MSIIFYSAPWCGYCTKAEQILANELASGKIIKKSHTEAKGAPGFPYFVNPQTGGTHAGCPESGAQLIELLSKGSRPPPAENYGQKQPNIPHQKYKTLETSGRGQENSPTSDWWIGVL